MEACCFVLAKLKTAHWNPVVGEGGREEQAREYDKLGEVHLRVCRRHGCGFEHLLCATDILVPQPAARCNRE